MPKQCLCSKETEMLLLICLFLLLQKQTNLVFDDDSETSYGRRTCTFRGKTQFNGGHCCKPE